MKPVDPALREYIERVILPRYEAFDRAHGPDHVRTVLRNSMELAEDLLAEGVELDVDMVYAIAAFHDVGICFGREEHEVNSGRLFFEDEEMARRFTPAQRQLMREAIEDHRASRQSEPRSIYGRLISEADRDIDPERIVHRCMEYGLANYPAYSEEEQISRVMEHIREKYGENGYLHLWLPCKKNRQGLDTLRSWLRTGELADICKRYLP